MVNSPVTNPLSALQDRFAIIDLIGEIRVVDRHQINALLSGVTQGDTAMYKKPDAELMMKRYLEALPISCNPKQVVADFWTSPATMVYKGTGFTPKATPPTVLNYWIGPIPAPHSGNWEILRDYLHDVICAGDSLCFDYLINYMAHMIQRPEEKPGVMLVLLGGQGTGKGVYFSLLKAIWPRTTLQVADIDQVIGKFNAPLERNYVICMDEALFAGDRKSMDRLKSTVTESSIQIEQKYQPSRVIESVHRFFAASNHDHFGNVERDDRRFAFYRVSDHRQQDTAYFSAVAAAISDPTTLGAMVHHLLHKDITSFDIRLKPQSQELQKQKLMSLQGFERYWYEVLIIGSLTGCGMVNGFDPAEWDVSIFVPTTTILCHYTSFNKNAQRHQTVQSQHLGEALRRLCPSAQSDRQEIKDYGGANNGKRVRGFQLPDLDMARREFAAAMKIEIAWA
jgi:hypothetical protein